MMFHKNIMYNYIVAELDFVLMALSHEKFSHQN